MSKFRVLPRILIEGYNSGTLLFSSEGGEYKEVELTEKDEKLAKLIRSQFFYNFDGKKYLKKQIHKDSFFYEITDKEELVLKFSVPEEAELRTVVDNQFLISYGNVLKSASDTNKGKILELWGENDGKFVKLHSKVTETRYNEVSEQLIRLGRGGIKLYCFNREDNGKYFVYYVKFDKIHGPIGNRIPDELASITWPEVLILNSSQILMYAYGVMSFINDIGTNIKISQQIELDDNTNVHFDKITSTSFVASSSNQWLKFYSFDGSNWELTQTLVLNDIIIDDLKILTPSRDDFLKFAKLLPIDCLPLDLKVMTTEFCASV